jgi:hypothetical protein
VENILQRGVSAFLLLMRSTVTIMDDGELHETTLVCSARNYLLFIQQLNLKIICISKMLILNYGLDAAKPSYLKSLSEIRRLVYSSFL